MQILLDAKVHSVHVQVIRCDIKLRSVERSNDVQNRMLQEKSKGCTVLPLDTSFKIPTPFLAFFLRYRTVLDE
jgi:hypothetical protein